MKSVATGAASHTASSNLPSMAGAWEMRWADSCFFAPLSWAEAITLQTQHITIRSELNFGMEQILAAKVIVRQTTDVSEAILGLLTSLKRGRTSVGGIVVK